jgi:hypothetical protein
MEAIERATAVARADCSSPFVLRVSAPPCLHFFAASVTSVAGTL